MNLLPRSHKQFAESSYWDKFFQQRGKKAFEWYGEYLELCEPLLKYVKTNDKILMLGCGNSKLSMEMYDAGYKDLISIDISSVAIKGMKELNVKTRSELKFLQLDATDMSSEFVDSQFSVALDKGTLDALFVDTSEAVLESVEKYFAEIERVLRVGGRYLCVSLLQKHILNYILDYFPKHSFLLRIVYCRDAEQAQKERNMANSDDSETMAMPVFMVVATKFKALLTPVLEFSFSIDKTDRLTNIEELTNAVTSVQQAALVCSGLSRHSIAGHDEIILDICRPIDGAVRYTAFILEQTPSKHLGKFAALIVPQGRELEWIFCKPEGRRKMLETANYQRLVIVILNPKQHYESMDAIKLELTDTIRSLAPSSGDADQIPFLSIKSNENQCETLVKGSSKISGEFIVEEIITDDDKLLRRIIFLNNPHVTQSEALVKFVKGKGKKKRKRIDFGYLACQHHLYMSVGVQMAVTIATELNNEDKNIYQNVLVIGLGGGSLCSFLQKALPTVRIVAVEIDPMMLEIAEQYFELKLDDRLHVVIDDGLKFIEKCRSEGMQFDAILFDVDSKDLTMGISCPPTDFLEKEVLDNLKELIGPQGFFILNLVCRNDALREDVVRNLAKVFPATRSNKMDQYLNEIIYCTNNQKFHPIDSWEKILISSAQALKAAIKVNIAQNNDILDIQEFIQNLQL